MLTDPQAWGVWDAEASVRRGIAWLDRHHPGWRAEVDWDHLDLSRSATDIFAHMDRGFAVRSYPGYRREWFLEYGMAIPYPSSRLGWAALTLLWKALGRDDAAR